jgi:hypothetical protein
MGVLVATLLLGLFAVTGSVWATSYTFETLECKEANTGTTIATGINDSGEVSGYYIGSDGHYHGFLRSVGGACTEIGGPNGETAYALGINNNGDVVGLYFKDSTPVGFVRSAEGGNLTTFNFSTGAWSEPVPNGYYMGINDNGQVAGTLEDHNGGGVHGFVRSAKGVVTTFDYPSASQTYANGINNYGEVTGFYFDAKMQHMYCYVRSADGKDFSSFVYPNAPDVTWAYGINDGGQVAGVYQNLVQHGEAYHAFVRSADGLEFSTFDYPQATGGTYALGINYTGQVVGFAYVPSEVGFAHVPSAAISLYSPASFIATPVSTLPSIDKPISSAITTTTATLGATIESTGGYSITAAGVAYGKSKNPTPSSAGKVGTSIKKGAFQVKVTGLTSNTLYHFRGYATNSSPATGYTADSTFTTIAAAPEATAATDISASGFTANWTAPPGTATLKNYFLDIATDASFSSFVSGYKNRSIPKSGVKVTGLTSGKTYYYRVRAANAEGTSVNSNSEKVVLPSISIISPTSGEKLKVSGKCLVKWTYTGQPGPVEITLLRGGVRFSTIISSTTVGSNGTGSFSWTIPGSEAAGSDYQIKVSSTTISSCTATSKGFTIIR